MNSTRLPLARRLAAAHCGETLVRARGEAEIAGVEEAYAIQDRVLAELARGERATAWKVSPPRAGAVPLASPVPPSGVHRSPVCLAAGARTILGIEAEVAFRFREAPPLGANNVAEMAHSIGEALVLIELCETRLADWDEASTLWKLADFQSHGAFVLGTGTANWRAIDFGGQEAIVTVNGAVVARGVGSHPSGDPSALLPWAADHCARRGMPLAAGDVVTLGSWTGMTALAAGDEALAVFPGIGEARLALAR